MKWWQHAVFYQIYPRSFADGNGDGIGDLAGIRTRLDYLSRLGVDALWISPFLRSPQVDHGYDVSDYYDVDPLFGTLEDFDRLLEDAHAHGMRLTMDLVPNHCSAQHPWFQAALSAGRGTKERDRFLFRDGSGPNGALAPTEVGSIFGGSAWTRIREADGQLGQWYFHLFDPSQPDLNWRNHEVLEEFKRVLRFWLDRGVDGFRIDVGDALIKHPLLRADDADKPLIVKGAHSEVHAIYRQFRAVMDEYEGDRMAVLEMGDDRDVVMLFVRPDEMHLNFNFPFMHPRVWDNAAALRQSIDLGLWTRGATGTTPTWVTDNHDSPRSVTRYAVDSDRDGPDEGGNGGSDPHSANARVDQSTDIELGTRRARAMAFLLLSLPGTAYIYNGQELGLPNVDDLPESALQDPVWERSSHTDRGRDGARIPLPWAGDAPPFGFSSDVRQPWLPQPREWANRTVSNQDLDSSSMLNLYRKLIWLRREHPALRCGALAWLPGPEHVLGFERMAFPDEHSDSAVIEVWLNLSKSPLPLPAGEVLASSVPLQPVPPSADPSTNDSVPAVPGRSQATLLPRDAAAWVRTR